MASWLNGKNMISNISRLNFVLLFTGVIALEIDFSYFVPPSKEKPTYTINRIKNCTTWILQKISSAEMHSCPFFVYAVNVTNLTQIWDND